jgi:hypothetical protein
MTIAYSALGSVGIWISATEGDCGSVDGRGILFDLYVLPVENILQSYCSVSMRSSSSTFSSIKWGWTYCHGRLRS